MSHLVTVQTKLRDPAAVAAACRRLGLPEPVQGTAKLYASEATGLIVQLPGWRYPAVIDVTTGDVRYDTYQGACGEPQQLYRFLQGYAVEKALREARQRGFQVSEQTLGDGSIRLNIIEGSAS